MKKIKYLILILTIFLITGCNATYNLTIKERAYKEELIINATEISENKSLILYPQPVYINTDIDDVTSINEKLENEKYYDDKEEYIGDLKQLTYSYKHTSKDSLKQSSILNNNFDLLVISKYKTEDNKIYSYISTSENSNYLDNMEELESITVNITNTYKVISHNADSVNNNVYTWIITKNNPKAINMVYDENIIVSKKEKILNNNIVMYFLTVIPLAILIFIIYKAFKKYSNNKNVMP